MKNQNLLQKTKYLLLKSFLVTDEKKKELLNELPSFSEEQLEALQKALVEYEEKAAPLLKAALQGEEGEFYLDKLKKTYKELKRKTYKELEKESISKESPDEELEQLLKNV